MTVERFWVLGGQYSCPAFKTLNGQAEVLGPFEDRDQAQAAWKEASTRGGGALARYSIASEQLNLAN